MKGFKLLYNFKKLKKKLYKKRNVRKRFCCMNLNKNNNLIG